LSVIKVLTICSRGRGLYFCNISQADKGN